MTGFSKLVIYRNGTLIDSNVTTSPYTDPATLAPNTTYIYKILAYDSSGVPGTPVYKTIVTLPTLTSITVSSVSSSQINLTFVGAYSYLSISRNGTFVANDISGTTFSNAGLSPNYSYTYLVTPYNVNGDAGTALSTTQLTLGNVTSISATSPTTTSIVLTYGGSGSYTNVSITRNGTPIATNITGTTFTDSSGLTPHTSYTYNIIPYNSDNIIGPSVSITKYTLPTLTSLTVTSKTASQVVLAYDGSYTNVSITRNGTAISTATNITGITFTDTGLTTNTSYTYVVTPNNLSGSGATLSITQLTLGNITSFSIPSATVTTTTEKLDYSGNYTNVSITRNGIAISTATNITGITFTDTGLTPHTSYTYAVFPNNSAGTGVSSSITKGTLPILTSLDASASSSSQIVLTYAGSYTNVSITRDGISIATGITTSTYTDSSGLSANTSYTYAVTPNNTSGAGSTLSTTRYTLPNITSLSVSSETTAQTVLAYSGNYTNVSITRNGTAIATNITGTSYTDAGLASNTSYTYVVTPYNSDGRAGSTSSIVNVTLPYIVSISVSSETTSQIVLAYSGNYTNVSITRNGSAIATHVSGTSYTDSSGLAVNSSYIYVVTPYNSDNEAGSSSTITHSTLGLLTSVSVTSETTTQIVLAYTGSYATVSITRNGSAISTATNITGTGFTDTGLTVNTSYTYVITPYNVNGARCRAG